MPESPIVDNARSYSDIPSPFFFVDTKLTRNADLRLEVQWATSGTTWREPFDGFMVKYV